MRRALFALMAALPLSLTAACGDKGDDDDDGDTGSDGGDAGDDGGDAGDDGGDAGCPDEVPEEYRYIWDCQADTCGGSMFYRYGTGQSDADGNLVVTERWFLFNGGSDWCVDTFEVSGEASPIDPTTFNCSQCEETYEIQWEQASADCGVIWGGLFFGQDGAGEEAPYEGFLMFDTHTAFGDRNPENAMLVIGAPVLGNSYYPQSDYARGTAVPSSSADAPPEDYVYVNAGSCLGGSTARGPTVVDPDGGPVPWAGTPTAP